MEIRELLQKPLEGLNNSNVHAKFREIATNLFRKFCIKCGTKKYYFAEIEFYYYDRDDKKGLNKSWNEKTYPRDKKNAGDLFFHYSGVDICFDSSFKEGRFGGILIRSLKDDNGKFITGPFVCMLELLNVSSKDWPRLEYLKDNEEYLDYELCDNPVVRYGIIDEALCFFDKNLYEKFIDKNTNKETFENVRWDYSKKKDGSVRGISTLNRYYHRFDEKQIVSK